MKNQVKSNLEQRSLTGPIRLLTIETEILRFQFLQDKELRIELKTTITRKDFTVLLVLREVMHHLGFDEIAFLDGYYGR